MEENSINKIPPHDIEAEQAVLGSMLVDKEAVATAIEYLKQEDFYRKDNEVIFSAMMELYSQGKPIDILTVKDVLTSRQMLEAVGGIEYLSSVASSVYTTANIEMYAKIVEEKSILRRLIKSSNEIVKLGFDAKDDVEDILDQAEKKIFDILEKRNTKGYTPIKDVLVDTFAKLEELYNQTTTVTGVPSGFIDLDNRTSGFQPANLVLIAARPAMGKSAFVLNIAQNAAIRHNTGVAIFSLEMAKEELVNRMLCSEAMVDSSKIRNGKMEDEDWVKLAKALGPLSEAPIYIDDTPGLSTMELRAKCRKLKLEKNIGLVIIDYLQLMKGSKSESRQQEISEISRSLKILAKELGIPVIALSQLSRAPEQRPDHRPILSDLRESGSIEQDADIVMFLYRDDYYNEESEKKNVAEVIIAKQRSGPTGTAELLWLGQYTKFANLDKFR
ncbi:MAG: replicative DNA helicase [Clostridiales bacterium]|nr:replicative DNA helicase [Clostridiales bacterium]